MKKISLRASLVALNAVALLGVLAFEVTRAMDVVPSAGTNYSLQLLHRTAHAFNPSYDDGEESVRVEEVMMRTSTHPKIVRWRKELDQLRGKTPMEQLEAVNRIINGDVTYRSDYQHWKREDKWGFPFATLDEGGDCEDFAMLKRVSLHYLGWPQDGLYLLMGYTTMNGKPETHAVLLVRTSEGRQYILDSMEKHVLPPAADHHFKPMMAVDRAYLYMVSLGGRV
jgi:predicted transglutaminase-like cysteine proteinase